MIETIDARPSDAVALAVRFDCPIFTTEEVLQSAGLILQEEEPREETEEIDQPEKGKADNPIASASDSELNIMLDKAVKNEDYEMAARIRDELDRRGL